MKVYDALSRHGFKFTTYEGQKKHKKRRRLNLMGAGGRTIKVESPALIMHRREYNIV
jgi:hypothetical protein